MRGTLVGLALLLSVTSAALADEAPTLLPGSVAIVKGTTIGCIPVTGGTGIRCAAQAGLSVTLSKTGAVRVTRGKKVVLSRSPASAAGKQLKLGINSGFMLPGASIYCHVYAAPAPTLTCSTIEPAGGLPKTYGFDMSKRRVTIFQYGNNHDRHDLKTLRNST